MTARMDIVDLLIDCDNFSADAYLAGELRHTDGRPFTDEEHAKVGSATRAEIEAMAAYSGMVAEYHKDVLGDHEALKALVDPYFAKLGSEATLGEVRADMSEPDKAKLDEIMDRLTLAAAAETPERMKVVASVNTPGSKSHSLIYLDEVQEALSSVENCPVCKGGLGICVEENGEWEIVELHAIGCTHRKATP